MTDFGMMVIFIPMFSFLAFRLGMLWREENPK